LRTSLRSQLEALAAREIEIALQRGIVRRRHAITGGERGESERNGNDS
jgi:hypothetical protein